MNIQTSVARLLTRAANTLLRPARVAEVAAPPLWFNNQRIGGELTPEEVASIIIRADQGFQYQLIDLAREAREKDCHLHACLSTFELSLAGMDVQIIPASDSVQDREIATWVEGFLTAFGPTAANDEMALGLPDLIQHLASGYYYSRAVAELIWEKRDGKTVPVTAVPIGARRFVYDQTSSELRFFDYSGSAAYPGLNLLEEFPDRFIQFCPNVLGTGAAREGLMRPLIWASLFRTWSIRDWLALAEMAWKPWRVGYYDKDKYSSDADIQKLLDAVNYMTTSGATMLPNNVELKVHWPEAKGGRNDSQHLALASFMADEMTKAILGTTLVAQQGNVGTQALGTVHNEIRKDRRDAAARAVAAVLRTQVVARAVRRNYGNDVPIPGVALVSDETDIKELAEIVTKLCGEKGPNPPISLAWFYAKMRMPVPKPGEDVIGNPWIGHMPTEAEKAQMAAAQQAANDTPPRAGKPNESDDGSDAGTDDSDGLSEEAMLRLRRIFRPKVRVLLNSDDAEVRREALAELEAAAAVELTRSSRRRRAA